MTQITDKTSAPAQMGAKNNLGSLEYVPNRLLRDDLQRRIYQAASQFPDMAVLLRPIRRHILGRTHRLPENNYLPEFFQPCFAILSREHDPDKKPAMVIEIEDPGQAMKDLYKEFGVLWVLVRREDNTFKVECSHSGARLQLEVAENLFKALAAPLSWYERRISYPIGSYVHSLSERTLRQAVKILSPSFPIECHHQLPLSYVIGYRSDITAAEQKLLSKEIDAVITFNYEADADCSVVLPVKLDIHDSHREIKAMQDKQIEQLCQKYRVPLLVVRPGKESEVFTFDCPILDLPTGSSRGPNPDSWANALAPMLGAAVKYSGKRF